MKLPRDLSADALAKRLARYGYSVTRQTGSHLRLTTTQGGEHHVTIPAHSSLSPSSALGVGLKNFLGCFRAGTSKNPFVVEGSGKRRKKKSAVVGTYPLELFYFAVIIAACICARSANTRMERPTTIGHWCSPIERSGVLVSGPWRGWGRLRKTASWF